MKYELNHGADKLQLVDYRNMSEAELVSVINKLKKEKNALILAHLYQPLAVQQVADFVGDSLMLSKKAKENSAELIVFCGVDFMAESAKILSPEKKVLLPEREASCPMANMCDAESLRGLKAEHPEAMVVTYINSTAEVKAESDVIVTSSNALKIINHFKDKKIIFTPDRNLGAYCQERTGADMILWDGFCCVHDEMSVADVYIAKQEHPNCLLLMHPEAPMEVLELADFIGSTNQIIDFVEESLDELSSEAGVIIGTEIEIARLLQKKHPDKAIYALADHAVCRQMKMVDLAKVAYCLDSESGAMEVDPKVRAKALAALNKMLELS